MDELTQLNSTRAPKRDQLTKLENQQMQIDEKVSEYEANIRLANRESYEIRSSTDQAHEMSKRNRI